MAWGTQCYAQQLRDDRKIEIPLPLKNKSEQILYRVLCLKGKPKGIGFIRRNTDSSRRKDLYINSIKEVERITGMTFFPNLPQEISESVKSQANLKDWE